MGSRGTSQGHCSCDESPTFDQPNLSISGKQKLVMERQFGNAVEKNVKEAWRENRKELLQVFRQNPGCSQNRNALLFPRSGGEEAN